MARRGVVTAGHYLASSAGLRIMMAGGNAIDAAAAMGVCLPLLEPQLCGIGGEVPTLIYSARERKTYAISGMGWSPAAFSIDWCRDHGIDLIPGDGYLPACVPAVVGTWAAAVARFGTMSFAEILQPAIELAEQGFPVYEALSRHLHRERETYAERYPTTAAVYFPGGKAPSVGETLRNPDFGAMLRIMCRAEERAKGRGRVAGIEAACDAFYRGEIAERIVRFIGDHPVADASGAAHTGLLTVADMAEWRAGVEEPVTLNYRGLDVYKCSSWTQGPVFLQQLGILQHLDLKALGHNSADYLHTWIECAKLAFADREAYYGDPAFDAVPLDVLLSAGYGERRAAQIQQTASLELRPGDLGTGVAEYAARGVLDDNRLALGMAADSSSAAGAGRGAAPSAEPRLGDTTHLDAVDAEGNMVAATPSGGWIGSSPVIAGLGFPLGTRGQMFFLNPGRPNALQPRKRPRATLTPTIVTRDGAPYMAFGTPGGDGQDQWTLQFFLNYVDFGTDLQQALDAPTVHTSHFPSSFYPRTAHPGRVEAESRLPEAVLAELRRRGHDIVLNDGWNHGKALAIRCDADRGLIAGAATARNNIAYAMGW
jgi:gamma-glutamyltranspeptidase/glutathione hydrolase